VRWACKAIGKDAIIAHATGCMEIVSSGMPQNRLDASLDSRGLRKHLGGGFRHRIRPEGPERKGKLKGPMPKVVAMGGDGRHQRHRLQALSGALERGHNFTYICWDNEAYMNTGIQRSSATPFGP